MSKKRALIVCPGRGTYNASELGYLAIHHGGGGAPVAMLNNMRKALGQLTIGELDSAEKFSPSTHLRGDNASLLIYACAMADFAAIDRDRYEIVAVTGNSMGWYLALAAADVLDFAGGAQLVNNMGALMHSEGAGGQVVWSLVDDDWCIDAQRLLVVQDILAQANARSDLSVHVSIRLGGMIVFAADEPGLKWLMDVLPKEDRFPMRLSQHAAFHSEIVAPLIARAQAKNAPDNFGTSSVALVDGTGRVWNPSAFSRDALYEYTLGTQISQTYDFTRAVQVAAAEFAPDVIICLGPGSTLGAPIAQSLIQSGWKGLSGKKDFQARQLQEPLLISMGMSDQRSSAVARL